MNLLLLLSTLLAAEPVPEAVQRAVEVALARQAVEAVPGSLQRASAPECPPYRFFTFRDARAGQTRGVAVSETGEIALAGGPEGFGGFLAQTRLLETRPPKDVLEVWRLLEQTGPVLGADEIAALPEAERAAVHPPRGLQREGALGVEGFVRQGEELFRVEVVLAAGPRAQVTVRTLDEILGRDEIDQAVRALRTGDEIVRSAAAFELGERKDPRVVPALAAALADRSANVRATAAQGLRRQGALDPARRPEQLAALRKALAREADPIAREALMAALSELERTGAKGR